jgi:ribose 5-phosphate isomerase A
MAGVEQLKEQAGIAACRFVTDGMALGLGTGSTVRYSIIEIARMIKEEGIEVVGVPTSEDTRRLADHLDIPLRTIDVATNLDLTIDGADEFDPKFDLIKGGGGALTREKVVAKASNSMVVVADETKQVSTLGEFDLPIEVDSILWEDVRDGISSICPGEVRLRGGDEDPYITDNQGFILDCSFGPTISNPESLEREISEIPGVVEVGLFVGICDAVVMASSGGVETLVKPDGRL